MLGLVNFTAAAAAALRAAPRKGFVTVAKIGGPQVKRFAERTVPNANRVFIPKEELSLDVIKQYKVVRARFSFSWDFPRQLSGLYARTTTIVSVLCLIAYMCICSLVQL